jgi:hypothetical protein
MYCDDLFSCNLECERNHINLFYNDYIYSAVQGYLTCYNDYEVVLWLLKPNEPVIRSMSLKCNAYGRKRLWDITFYFRGWYGSLCGIFHEYCFEAVCRQLTSSDVVKNILKHTGIMVSQRLVARQLGFYSRNILVQLNSTGETVEQ